MALIKVGSFDDFSVKSKTDVLKKHGFLNHIKPIHPFAVIDKLSYNHTLFLVVTLFLLVSIPNKSYSQSMSETKQLIKTTILKSNLRVMSYDYSNFFIEKKDITIEFSEEYDDLIIKDDAFSSPTSKYWGAIRIKFEDLDEIDFDEPDDDDEQFYFSITSDTDLGIRIYNHKTVEINTEKPISVEIATLLFEGLDNNQVIELIKAFDHMAELKGRKPKVKPPKLGGANESLGLSEFEISYLCNSAQLLTTPTFNGVNNLTSFEETLFTLGKQKKFLYELHKQKIALPEDSKAEIGQLWNTKLNQVYCPTGQGFAPSGYIEFQLLMSGQMDALKHMYGNLPLSSERSNYHLDINRLLKKDPYSSNDGDKWITLADLIKHYIENPIGQMNQRQGLRDRFKEYYNLITQKWGGKHYSELAPIYGKMEDTKGHLKNYPNNVVLNFKLANNLIEITHPTSYSQYDKAFGLIKQQGKTAMPDRFYFDEIQFLLANRRMQQAYDLIDYYYSPTSQMAFIHYFKGVRERKRFPFSYEKGVEAAKPYFDVAAKLGFASYKQMRDNTLTSFPFK